ncbi:MULTISPECIES: exodeoxyribonuclease III [Actinomyces]|uniref:Endonuclease/exonuclease/phosphatase family protein n=1 Tax=Actinomyces respiraculi TaxID=2744574 RepID=A0A7T0LM04_9ACTO|nr:MULTISPECIES: exodeoxyribonuclease III [Actinomyces]QPL06092.1 endonuclease/exonuclease/phosphatase family protein [Actinomyces respiraculi]
MRIATVNVNGIRAAARKGMAAWIESSAPDVMLLQEVRADEETAAALLPGYTSVVWPCRIKGRAGTAVAVREDGSLALGEARYGVAAPGTEEPDVDSGRWLEVDLLPSGAGEGAKEEPALTVVSAYLHSGQLGTEKMDQKYAHLDLVDARMAALLARAADGGPQVLMAGDLNVVRSAQDIKNWKPNHNKIAGVMDEEIAHLESWFASGWIDVARSLAPEEQGPYTWWSQRGQAFDNNAGWRIDYQVATPALAGRAASARVDRAASYAERWSDHAPLVIDYTD